MPRYYCDYCDTYLTHDSPSVRKQHNAGYKHKANVRNYYQQFEEQQTQSLIDQKIKQHLSGQAAFGQIGPQYAAWRPGARPPILPVLPIPGAVPPNAPMASGIRIPVLPRPTGVPVFGTTPVPVPAPVPGQPGASTAPVQTIGPPPGPPAVTTPSSVPGATPPGPGAASATASHPMYPGMPGSGSFGGASVPPASSFPSAGGNATYPTTSSADSFTFSQALNSSH